MTPDSIYTAGAIAGSGFTVTATDGLISGQASVTVNDPDPPVLTTIQVTPITATVDIGATQQFTAQGLDQFGNAIGASISWEATGGTIDDTGLYTAGAIAGSGFTVTATDGLINGQASVTVNDPDPPVLTTVQVTPNQVTVDIGANQQFTAQGLDQFGNSIGASITWGATGGTVDDTGLYTAGAIAGSGFTVTATDGLINGQASVTVNDPDPPVLTTIQVTPNQVTVDIGANQQFTAQGLDQFGNSIGASITWGATGGTVDDTGLYTAGAITGSGFTVTATAGLINGQASVTVNDPDPPVLTTIVVTPDSATVNVGDTQQFTAQGLDQFGNSIGSSITWDATGGTIDDTGLYTAGAIAGSFTVTATDGFLDSNIVTITVSALNDVPVARDDVYSTDEDTPVTVDVLVNDDLGNEPNMVSFDATSVKGGTVTDNGDGTFTYAPATSFNGSDAFTYTITDFDGEFSTATVTINVTAVITTLPSSNTSPSSSSSDDDDDDDDDNYYPVADEPENDVEPATGSDPVEPASTPASDTTTIDTTTIDTTTIDTTTIDTTTIDTTAPETTITVSPAGFSSDAMPGFEFTSSESGSTFECRLDGGAFAACTSPWTYFAGVTDGSHTFEVRATDSLGNTDATPASYAWTIDATAPDTSITVKPADPSNDAVPGFEFASTEPDGGFECSLDGAAFAACSSPWTYFAGMTDGSHTFEVRATDSLGNTDATPASYAWTIDATAPDTIITVKPTDPSSDDTPSFEFTSTEAGSTFECSLDGAAFAACDTPLTYSEGVTDGSHTFEVRATDSLGNTDATPASYTWTIDTKSPVAPTAVPSFTTAIGGGGSPEDGGSGVNPALIGGLALGVLALLAFLILLAKRRRRQEDEA